ncbi:signal peptidase I [Humibacter ginsenosidimutans]|uniref:Signal peptidase I n=1 Tax=Humibacter ginsenosidimutans TaxID=2599293 RepID=A0A5B8LZZ0_9MICO|nr:signal peptidase I [Humibacter ginsenosidimutans]QDZ14088.1 signal peptidase I [Humibacter ginsenosidimutans]
MTDEPLPSRSARSASEKKTKQRSVKLFIRDLVIIFLVAILVSFLIKTFLVRSFYIPSSSMEDTLRVNDLILVNELEPNLMPIHRGDVVVFTDPGGWLPPSTEKSNTNPIEWALSLVGLAAPDSDDHLVKRVIGLPGDKVSCCNALGQMSVNGSPLVEPYIKLPPGEQEAASLHFSVTVPKGELWVMGDNRWDSQDSSRNQNLPGKGFVPEKDVVGRAILITWPISHWSWLSNYPDVFRGADDDKQ